MSTPAQYTLETDLHRTLVIDPEARVMVGLSGGVDSSVAAFLLAQSCQTQTLFMKNWEEDDRDGVCTAAQDLQDASDVATQLGLKLHTRNFASEYWEQVFSHCLDEFRAGRTPNPDILCNREIKFRVFLEHALELGADYIATGHYARRQERDGLWQLVRSLDRNKDQTYFLHALNQAQLGHALFPLGDLTKPQVRELARQLGLSTHAKKDSTGICFIGERNFRQFLQQYIPAQPGEIRSTEGKLIGQHQGLMFHTLGQRKGLGIGGMRDAGEQPWYVVAKDLASNTLIVGQSHDHPLLYSRTLTATDVTWISGQAPERDSGYHCQLRYRQADQPCRISDIQGDTMTLEFQQPQRAVTPGQSVVIYEGDICLGGGIIDHALQ